MTTIPFNDQQMLSLIRSRGPRLRAEVEDTARSRCDQYLSGRGTVSWDQAESMLRAETGRAAREVFMRESEPMRQWLVRIMAVRIPRYTFSHRPDGSIEVLAQDDGLTPELRAVVAQIEACMNEYAAIFYGPPAADKDGTTTRRTT